MRLKIRSVAFESLIRRFYIAEQDLILRGGGEILGTKQSGEPDFFFANLGRDLEILLQANKRALEIEFSELISSDIPSRISTPGP